MVNRRIVIVVLAFMAALVVACVTLWAWLGAWYGLLPLGVLVVVEYVLQCRKYKTWKTPMVMWCVRWIRSMWQTCSMWWKKWNDAGNAAAQVVVEPGRKPIVSSIADLLLKDFITCCVYRDLGVLGEGTEEELQRAFTGLLSQYYEVKNDERVKYEVKLRKDIASLELRRYKVDVLCAILRKRYSVAAADGLRQLYPKYALTEQTLGADLEMIGKAEISKHMERERACQKLDRLYAQQHNDKKESPERQYRNFISRLMDINKVEGVRYDMQTITVMEYAIAEARLTDHVAMLKEQANGRG